MLPKQEPDPAVIVGNHATDDALELYSLKLLKGRDLEALEEHLLTCPICRHGLDQMDQTISFLRQELKQHELQRRESELKSRNADGKIILFKRRN